MQRKIIFAGLGIAVMVAVIALVIFQQPGKVNADKIFLAAQAYTRSLQSQGRPIPATVDLKELIDRRLLNPSDVSGFAGADVVVSLLSDSNDPQAVLMRARFDDGHEIVMLSDGAVHSK